MWHFRSSKASVKTYQPADGKPGRLDHCSIAFIKKVGHAQQRDVFIS